MKKQIASIIFTLILSVMTLLTLAQPPYYPPSPYTNGNGTNITGGGLHNGTGVPIDGGTGILLILATVFGMRKVYNANRSKQVK